MGALHEGHSALFAAARPACDVLVASVFVNPAQFSDSADLAAYPRDLERDATFATGVDVIFAPPAEQITALYGNRWQVEIGIKRLKTLGRLDELPSADPTLARTWLLAHLIAAVLTDDLAN